VEQQGIEPWSIHKRQYFVDRFKRADLVSQKSTTLFSLFRKKGKHNLLCFWSQVHNELGSYAAIAIEGWLLNRAITFVLPFKRVPIL